MLLREYWESLIIEAIKAGGVIDYPFSKWDDFSEVVNVDSHILKLNNNLTAEDTIITTKVVMKAVNTIINFDLVKPPRLAFGLINIFVSEDDSTMSAINLRGSMILELLTYEPDVYNAIFNDDICNYMTLNEFYEILDTDTVYVKSYKLTTTPLVCTLADDKNESIAKLKFNSNENVKIVFIKENECEIYSPEAIIISVD